eukprot:TRINITY_DN17630_c0_g1_i1.p1 TRINITY_DN17630_c0_g1~~TRINITY_DN17630_c0_g1_i1.p1  ORF type:complete len:746 (-),score=175.11 TRINITY_DN17630_c0_g1_i1:33-2270(-)
MADKVAAAVAAAMAEPATSPAALASSPAMQFSNGPAGQRLMTAIVNFHVPVFFPVRRVTLRLTERTGQTEERLITQYPHEVTLNLRPDAVLRIELTPSGPSLLGPEAFAPLVIPLRKVVEEGMALSFCTLWLGVSTVRGVALNFASASDEELDQDFVRALMRGQDLEAPKIGIGLKFYDSYAAEADRLSMFSVVDMYSEAVAQVYLKAEAVLRERAAAEADARRLPAAAADTLAKSEARAEAAVEAAEAARAEAAAKAAEVAEEAARASEAALRERDGRIAALLADVHTLRLARKDLQRRLTKAQEEALLAWKGAACSGGGSSAPVSRARGETLRRGDAGEGSSALASRARGETPRRGDAGEAQQRAEKVAERERMRARGLEKELREVRKQLQELLAERAAAAENEAECAASAAKAVVEDPEEQMALQGTLQQEEPRQSAKQEAATILALRKEVGSLAKSRSTARRRVGLLEQQLLEARRQGHELERRLEEVEHERSVFDSAVPGGVGPASRLLYRQDSYEEGGSSSQLHRLREENVDLHEELRRVRAENCRSRADLAPLRDENARLNAELRELLRSRLQRAEETSGGACSSRPAWGQALSPMAREASSSRPREASVRQLRRAPSAPPPGRSPLRSQRLLSRDALAGHERMWRERPSSRDRGGRGGEAASAEGGSSAGDSSRCCRAATFPATSSIGSAAEEGRGGAGLVSATAVPIAASTPSAAPAAATAIPAAHERRGRSSNRL